MGPGAPGGDAGERDDLTGADRAGSGARAVLDRWEEHGAVWRVATLTPERAQVDLCACTGEPVDRLESGDPDLIAYLRVRPSSES